MQHLGKPLVAALGVLALIAGLIVPSSGAYAATVDYSLDLSPEATLVDDQRLESYTTAMSADGKKVAAGWTTTGHAQNAAFVVLGVVSGSNVTWGTPTELTKPASTAIGIQLALNADGSKLFGAVALDNEAWIGLADISGTSLTNSKSSTVALAGGARITLFKAVIGDDFTLGAVLGAVPSSVRAATFQADSSNEIKVSGQQTALSGNPGQIELVGDSTGAKSTAVFTDVDKTQARAIFASPGAEQPSINFNERATVFDGYHQVSASSSANGNTTIAWTSDRKVFTRSLVYGTNDFTLGDQSQVSKNEGEVFRTPSVSRSANGSTVLVTWLAAAAGEQDRVIGTTGTLSGSTASWANSQNVSAVGYSLSQTSTMSSDGKSGVAVYLLGSEPANRKLQIQPVSIDGKSSKWGKVTKLTDDLRSQSAVAAMSSTTGTSVVWRTDDIVRARVGLLKSHVAPKPTPTVKKKQVPAKHCVVTPRKLPRKGTRVLMKPNCKTNARQKVKVKVRAKLRQRGEVTYYRVYRVKSGKHKGQTRIRTYGYKIRASIAWSAPSTKTYKAYKKSVVRKN